MDNELQAKGYKVFNVTLANESYEVKDDTAKAIAFNGKELELNPDLQYVRFIMCHEGANANGDFFTKPVLKQAQLTPRYKPVDWEHGQPMIGVILDSRYGETEDGVGYIEAIGVVWKFIYPELADQIKTKSTDGVLKLSMECYYKDAQYKVGENVYSQEQAEKLGIVDYVGRSYMGKPVYRVFDEVIFGGVGVVANPADKQAVFLAVAKDLASNSGEFHNEEAGLSSEERDKLPDSDFAVPSKRKLPIPDKKHVKLAWDMVDKTQGLTDEEKKEAKSRILRKAKELGLDTSNWEKPSKANFHSPTNDFTVKLPSSSITNAVIVANYVKAFDKAKSSLVNRFNKEGLKTKQQLASEIRNVLGEFKKELSEINRSYLQTYASDNLEQEVNEMDNKRKAEVEDIFEHDLDSDTEETYEDKLAHPSDNHVDEDPDFDQVEHADVKEGWINPDVEHADDMEESDAETNSEIDDNESAADVKKKFIDPEVEEANKSQVPPKKYQNKNNNTPSNDPDQDEPDNESHAEVKEQWIEPAQGKPDEYEGGAKEPNEEDNFSSNKFKGKEDSGTSLEDKYKAQVKAYKKLKTAYDAVVAELDSIKSEQVAVARMNELKEVGISFSEARVGKEIEKLAKMDQDAYADYKELLLEVAGKKAPEAVQTAEASEDDVEEVVLVEGIQASSAGLNVEHVGRTNRKPFSNLSL